MSAHDPSPRSQVPFRPPPAIMTGSRPMQRMRSSSSARTTRDCLERSGAPGVSAYDLPDPNAMAELELSRSASRGSNHGAHDGACSGPARGRAGSGMENATQACRTKFGEKSRCHHSHIQEEEGEHEGENAEAASSTGKGESPEQKADRMYARFSERRKSVIVAIVAYAALLAPFASSSFLPSIPQISNDLDTTPTILNATVAVYIFVIGLVPLIWAPYAGAYGRRPIYCLSLPIFAVGSLGVALSDSVASLVVTRIIQGAGSSAVLSVGAGTIGDIYPRQRRGRAFGLFYSGVLVGPALAPTVAGVLTEYVNHPQPGYGWRAMQWLLFAMGVLAAALCFFLLPETIHERGIDVLREEAGRDPAKDVIGHDVESQTRTSASSPQPRPWWDVRSWEFLWLNPLEPLKLLMLPHILMMSLTSSFVLMSTYTVLVPLTQTVAPRYNITNAALLGCFYLAQGLGNISVARVTGRYADWTLARWLKRRHGVYVAEDRLRATLIGAGGILPASVLTLGWILDRVGGKAGLGLTVVLLFFNGVGLMAILTALNTYIVDTLPHRSSEAIAANNFMRYTFSAAASAFVLPMIQAIGVGWTNTFSAAMVWVAFGLILLTIKYGKQMRKFGKRWEGGSDQADADAEKDLAPGQQGDEEKGHRERDSERTVVEAPTNQIAEEQVSKQQSQDAQAIGHAADDSARR